MYVIVDLVVLVSFAADQMDCRISSVLIHRVLQFLKIYLLLNCSSRRGIVVTAWEGWDLSITVQNGGLSPHFQCDVETSCSATSQWIKMGMCWRMLAGCSEFGTKASSCDFIQAVLGTTVPLQPSPGMFLWSGWSWFRLVAWPVKAQSDTCRLLRHCVQQLTTLWLSRQHLLEVVRNWAERKSSEKNISFKWRWPPSKIGPIPVLLFYSSYYFLTVCVWRYFLSRWKSPLYRSQCSVSSF